MRTASFAWLLLVATAVPAVSQEPSEPNAPEATAPADAAEPAEPPQPTADNSAADEAVIRANAQKYDDAFNARDAKALAALWSPEAIYSDPDTGEEIVGREALEKYFTAVLKDNDTKLAVDVTGVDFVSPNVAIERGVAHVTAADGAVEDSTYSAVHVRQGGTWLLDRVTEEGVVKPPKSNYEHLKELEWMIGSWIDQDADVAIQTDVEWTKNKNFITRSFSATIGDQVDMSGMQIIGWDPAAKRIRSWVFDSDGGFGEGQWKGENGRWVIQYFGTLPDGSKMSGNNIMTYIDEESYGWQSLNRQINGQILPNIDEVVIVRAESEEEYEASAEAEATVESEVEADLEAAEEAQAAEPRAAAPAAENNAAPAANDAAQPAAPPAK